MSLNGNFITKKTAKGDNSCETFENMERKYNKKASSVSFVVVLFPNDLCVLP